MVRKRTRATSKRDQTPEVGTRKSVELIPKEPELLVTNKQTHLETSPVAGPSYTVTAARKSPHLPTPASESGSPITFRDTYESGQFPAPLSYELDSLEFENTRPGASVIEMDQNWVSGAVTRCNLSYVVADQ